MADNDFAKSGGSGNRAKTLRKPSQSFGAQSVSGAFSVEHATEVSVDGRGAAREGFIVGALARGIAALAALSAALVAFETELAIAPVSVAAARAWRGNPVVVFALVVALCADRHTSDRVTQFCWFSIERVSRN